VLPLLRIKRPDPLQLFASLSKTKKIQAAVDPSIKSFEFLHLTLICFLLFSKLRALIILISLKVIIIYISFLVQLSNQNESLSAVADNFDEF
jgi:hypothetical protein